MLASRAVEAATEDRAAVFARLTDRSLDRHYRLAAVILGDPLEAEDAVHDAALVAWRGFAGLRDLDRFEAWFGRILVNGCRDRLRARRRRPVIASIALLGDLDNGASPRVSVADVADRDELDRAFATLDPDHAVTVALRYYLDLTVAEIADRMGIPEGTVKSRLHHGLRRLRRAVERDAEQPR